MSVSTTNFLNVYEILNSSEEDNIFLDGYSLPESIYFEIKKMNNHLSYNTSVMTALSGESITTCLEHIILYTCEALNKGHSKAEIREMIADVFSSQYSKDAPHLLLGRCSILNNVASVQREDFNTKAFVYVNLLNPVIDEEDDSNFAVWLLLQEAITNYLLMKDTTAEKVMVLAKMNNLEGSACEVIPFTFRQGASNEN